MQKNTTNQFRSVRARRQKLAPIGTAEIQTTPDSCVNNSPASSREDQSPTSDASSLLGGVNRSHLTSSADTRLQSLIVRWFNLPDSLRNAIFAVANSAVLSHPPQPSSDCPRSELANELARECRNVVQSCLREEEWADADREFSLIISRGLARLGVPPHVKEAIVTLTDAALLLRQLRP